MVVYKQLVTNCCCWLHWLGDPNASLQCDRGHKICETVVASILDCVRYDKGAIHVIMS